MAEWQYYEVVIKKKQAWDRWEKTDSDGNYMETSAPQDFQDQWDTLGKWGWELMGVTDEPAGPP